MSQFLVRRQSANARRNSTLRARADGRSSVCALRRRSVCSGASRASYSTRCNERGGRLGRWTGAFVDRRNGCRESGGFWSGVSISCGVRVRLRIWDGLPVQEVT